MRKPNANYIDGCEPVKRPEITREPEPPESRNNQLLFVIADQPGGCYTSRQSIKLYQLEGVIVFCPDCGAENSKSQKFCTRCGTNLMVIDRARDILNEVSQGAGTSGVSPNVVLGLVGLISVVGFAATTIGTLTLNRMDTNTPMPFFFGVGGFITMILICRFLLNMIRPSGKPAIGQQPQANYAPPQAITGNTRRGLAEPAPAYQSIIEDQTKQFEKERQTK